MSLTEVCEQLSKLSDDELTARMAESQRVLEETQEAAGRNQTAMQVAEGERAVADSRHIARHNPAAVLARAEEVEALYARVKGRGCLFACHEAFGLLLDAGFVVMPDEDEEDEEKINPFALMTEGVRALLAEVECEREHERTARNRVQIAEWERDGALAIIAEMREFANKWARVGWRDFADPDIDATGLAHATNKCGEQMLAILEGG